MYEAEGSEQQEGCSENGGQTRDHSHANHNIIIVFIKEFGTPVEHQALTRSMYLHTVRAPPFVPVAFRVPCCTFLSRAASRGVVLTLHYHIVMSDCVQQLILAC